MSSRRLASLGFHLLMVSLKISVFQGVSCTAYLISYNNVQLQRQIHIRSLHRACNSENSDFKVILSIAIDHKSHKSFSIFFLI